VCITAKPEVHHCSNPAIKLSLIVAKLKIMILHIDGKRTLKELQDDFAAAFPYLRLEFFARPHRRMMRSSVRRKLNPFLQVATVRSHQRNGALTVEGNMTVQELEQLLQQQYDLCAQVYHFAKGDWLMTDAADVATLDELNEQGRREAHEQHHVYVQPRNFL
jgi:hypothetical protein